MIPIPLWIKFLIYFTKDKLLNFSYFGVVFKEIIVIWTLFRDLGKDFSQVLLVVFFQLDLIKRFLQGFWKEQLKILNVGSYSNHLDAHWVQIWEISYLLGWTLLGDL